MGLMPGVRRELNHSTVSNSSGSPTFGLTGAAGGTRATEGVAPAGASDSQRSPWARPQRQPVASAITVEMPAIDAALAPVLAGATSAAPIEDHDLADPLLLPIAIGIVTLIAAASVTWALLI